MTDAISILYLPLAACVVLVSIHVYLGLHVAQQRRVFVALALLHVAALGSAVGVMFGHDLRDTTSYLLSLGFALIGAAIVAFGRRPGSTRISRDALLGTVYALTAAAAVLALSRSAGDSEDLEEMLFGNLLSVSAPEVMTLAGIYAAVALLDYYLFRKKYLRISKGSGVDGDRSEDDGGLSDFLFYASFGVAVACAVAIAGVIVVFSFLVIPALAAMRFRTSIGAQFWIAWIVGAVGSAAGLIVSFQADLPTGATIVCTLVIVASLTAAVRRLSSRTSA